MKQKITACLLVFAIFLLFPVCVWAQETTLTTQIPASHTLHIEITGNGSVTVDTEAFSQTADVPVKRGSAPQITVAAGEKAKIKSVFFNDQDITENFHNGVYTLPQMCFDAALSVVFEAVPETPVTGDSFPIKGLSITMALSLSGMLLCGVWPKKKI